MECFESYEKWLEQFALDDELLQKVHKEMIGAQDEFLKTSRKMKYGDPVTVDLVVALERLNCTRLHFSTTAVLKQMEMTMARVLYQVSKMQDAQDKILESHDKQQKLLQPPA
jgi:hypothetical protein